MNIIFLTRRFNPQIGGVETHVYEIAKRLVKFGHKVTVVSEKSTSINLIADIVVDGINILKIDTGKEDWFKKFRIWKELWKIRHTLSQADIIHCHDVFFWYLPFRFRYPLKKVFTTFHGYETKFPPTKRAIFVRKISEKLSNGNICIGNYIQKWYGTKPTAVSYGGVSLVQDSKFKVQSSPPKSDQPLAEKLKISLIGRLENDIGVITYLKALNKLKKEKIKFDFQTIGEGKFRKQLEKYGKVIGSQKEINKYIANSNIVFCSSYLTMLQALVARKIIVAVYENKLKEDYLKLSPLSRFIYICKDADEVVNVVRSIQNTPWKSNAMVENGYEWVKKQTWDSVVNSYLSLWKL